jgi:hypothetical protein
MVVAVFALLMLAHGEPGAPTSDVTLVVHAERVRVGDSISGAAETEGAGPLIVSLLVEGEPPVEDQHVVNDTEQYNEFEFTATENMVGKEVYVEAVSASGVPVRVRVYVRP